MSSQAPSTAPVNDDLALDGRIAVITGAASGIGAATARRFVASGARVALIARRAERLRALADELGADRALALPTDVTEAAALDAAAAEAADRLGPVDLVVANAGIMLPAPLVERRAAEWRQMVDLNLVGVLDTVHAFLPALLESGDRGGATDLMLISSLGARATFPGYAVYGATKAAVSYLAAAWRSELGPRGVRVTAVEPGLTHSELAGNVAHAALADELAGMFEEIPALSSEDVAELLARTAALPAHASIPTLPILPSKQV